MNEKNVIVRSYEDSDWLGVKEFIKKYWREDHPMSSSKELFDWQLKGFGSETSKTMVLEYRDNIIGFRGFIPGLYQVPTRDNIEILAGAASAQWSVAEEYRSSKLGLLLQIEATKNLSVITGAGSTPTTSRLFYKHSKYHILEETNRYVLPLEPKGYYNLLANKPKFNLITSWVKNRINGEVTVIPCTPDIKTIAILWKQITFPLKIFSLYRNEEFWKWRYLESKGFKYLFFGEIENGGIIVGRIESIVSSEDKELDGKKIFRFIEMIPSQVDAWTGGRNHNFTELLQGVINYAIGEDCIAADFYCSTNRFNPILYSVGFQKYNITKTCSRSSLAMLFNPLQYVKRPIDLFCRVNIPGEWIVDSSFENVYMVKSEGDQDRPNVIAPSIT